MPKNLLQDIVKIKTVKRENIRPNGHDLPPARLVIREKISTKTNRPRYKLWFVAAISLFALLFALSFLFARAKVAVNPKTQNIALNQNLSAVKDNSDTSGLSFDLVVISDEANKVIQGEEQKDILTKAQGKIFLYNNFSSASQALAINTQLEGSNGKIYKTVSKTTVSGIKDGKPGKVAVGIYGAIAGEEYNSAPLDFKILNFKGTPKYSKFYARSDGDITGGLKGKYYQITDAQKQAVVGELKTALSAKLLQKTIDQIPGGFILFKDATFVNVDESDINTTSKTGGEDNMVPVTIKGTLYGFLFNEKKLTQEIAKRAIESSDENYDGSGVHIPNIKNLTFSLPAPASLSGFADVKNINFNLSGASQIVWDVDSVKLIADLLGRSKKDFNQILSNYSTIDSANVTFSPFWSRSFPAKEKNIKVIINEPK